MNQSKWIKDLPSYPTASRAMPMPTYPSPPSMDSIPSKDGCWWSLSGFWLTVACPPLYGERRGVLSTTTYAPEDTNRVSSAQFFKRSTGTEVSITCSEQQPKEVTYSLCSHPQQHTGVAFAEGAAGSPPLVPLCAFLAQSSTPQPGLILKCWWIH